uniref:Ectonucleoside triphosphate diphosphohydrolase 6 n=1 Tax=Mola mola TaxID=94237 RepID=A0A3Q4AZ08_MOLML
MKAPKLAGVFLIVGCLLTYLMFIKRPYATTKPDVVSLSQPRLTGAVAPLEDEGPTSAAATPRFQYSIIFDAGSTGTRIHIFKFRMEDRGLPSLDHETFRSIKPGLSAYADEPEEVRLPLLTPVVLSATAGLRLLPEEKAQNLLDTVSHVLNHEADFPACFLSGIFAWITLNFVTGGLQQADSTVGMLDLGGGSIQITFSPQDEKTVQTSSIENLRSFQMFNHTHMVYAHSHTPGSYLGLGLMSARLAILGGVEASPSVGGSTELVSPCLAPEYSGSWKYGDIIYTVKGLKAGESLYTACLTKVEKFLNRRVLQVSDTELDFYLLSYFYDRGVNLGLLEEGEEKTVLVSDYIQAAKRVCSGLTVSPQQSPFLCLDLVYISVLLQEFGFPPHKQFNLVQTVNKVGISWSLGAAFHDMEARKTH